MPPGRAKPSGPAPVIVGNRCGGPKPVRTASDEPLSGYHGSFAADLQEGSWAVGDAAAARSGDVDPVRLLISDHEEVAELVADLAQRRGDESGGRRALAE